MEIEAKFYLTDPDELRRRLSLLGGVLAHGPRLERNWRFDNADGRLAADGRVLRLRIDDQARLTFKTPSDVPEMRGEIEFEVSDPAAAQALLEALDYHPVWLYEKWRAVYRLDLAQVMLDELPFGSFVEIEAASLDAVERVARRLGLDWKRRLASSYLGLFARLRQSRQLAFREATFEAFADQSPVQPEELGASDAMTEMDPSPRQTRESHE